MTLNAAVFTFSSIKITNRPLATLKAHFLLFILPKKTQEIQHVLLAQGILLKARDVLGHAVLYALHCKEKTRPSTQVMLKAHGTGKRSKPETSAGKNPKHPLQLKRQRQLRAMWKKRVKAATLKQ